MCGNSPASCLREENNTVVESTGKVFLATSAADARVSCNGKLFLRY